MPPFLRMLFLMACLALQACSTAAPPPGEVGDTAAPLADSAPAAAPLSAAPALPTSEVPRPGVPAPEAVAEGDEASVDYSCTTDADCAVKDVGNCCGYYPACVNVDSPTFPERVKAQCAKEGMSSICGFPTIESCVCKAGRCEAGASALQVE